MDEGHGSKRQRERDRERLGVTSFCPLRPFLDCPSPVKSSCNASTVTVPLLSRCIPPSTLSDNRAMGDISVALKNGMGTVLPAAYMDQSYKDIDNETEVSMPQCETIAVSFPKCSKMSEKEKEPSQIGKI